MVDFFLARSYIWRITSDLVGSGASDTRARVLPLGDATGSRSQTNHSRLPLRILPLMMRWGWPLPSALTTITLGTVIR